ncbi:probable WRKY transcription factor 3 [Magnolia sinica]|uniref:probable WRKY transcription factor 3 n=1 Tax=Magnolia sinica TaxID=86752 RepID=UPI00265824FA|nr:probable WRKY transcription factor 3 [Magnolia sinica]
MVKDEPKKARKGGEDGERKGAKGGAKLTPPPAISPPDRSSFSQLLAGAMASPAPAQAVHSPVVGMDMKQTLVLTIAVDPARFPMVAGPGFISSPGFQGQFGMSHQEALASVTAQAAQAQAHMQLVQVGYPSPSSGLPQQQRLLPVKEENVSMPEMEQHTLTDQKPQSAPTYLNTRSGDGFNWRKYGQKQVKGNDSSRSYYRCTHANCPVKKKVERCSNGHVTEIIYKGQHNHDPPQKVKWPKESGGQSGSGGPSGGSEIGDLLGENLSGSNPSTPRKEQSSGYATPEQPSHCTPDCEGDASIKVDEDHGDEPDPKRRIKDNALSACSTPSSKTVKEPKVVVQAASEPGSMDDGYRWRKYGQKIVKGNPNPRSYYKCTFTGCPVRKHVEKASGDAKSLVITYEGKHNHGQPTSRNSSDPPGTALLIAAAAAAVTADGQSPDGSADLKISTRCACASDADGKLAGEKVLELGGEKALESAETLLSIGLNSKPSEVNAGAKSPNVIQGPLFKENHTAVSV